MRVIGALECLFFNQRHYSERRPLGQKMLTFLTFLLCVSPGLGDDKPPDCEAQVPEFCSSPCTYLKDKCDGNRECIFGLCSYQFPQLSSRYLERCWDLLSDCTNEYRYRSKRGVSNKNVAYLLLKLHPFLNQTSQYGFLTSGRFRRITGSFGTEFLGKRSNNKFTAIRSSEVNQNSPINKATWTPKFYSLPLDKLAKIKILKRGAILPEVYADARGKRLSIRGNGRVVLGSEFLGKRGFFEKGRIRRLSGNKFFEKRNDEFLDGSEFLGKRAMGSLGEVDFPEKKQQEPLSGTELLGKKSSQRLDLDVQIKRFGNEILGKKPGEKGHPEMMSHRQFSLSKNNREYEFSPDYDPEPIDEVFYRYEPFDGPRTSAGSYFSGGKNAEICRRLKAK